MERYILKAGAAAGYVTPTKSMFLYGYPHVERYSQGIHDPLYATALVLDNGHTEIAFCAVDVICITKDLTREVRKRVKQTTGIPEEHIMLSASHTHSGPKTLDVISNKNDRAVPPVDKDYTDFLVDTLSRLISKAWAQRDTSELAVVTTTGEGIGGNRRDKNGLTDPEVPVIIIRRMRDRKVFAISSTYCMHPTVLHEDSKLYSADFPGYTREYILNRLDKDVVYLYHTGPSGNQSPRHFIKATTFDEAKRLGDMLGERIVNAVLNTTDEDFKSTVSLNAVISRVTLPLKKFPSIEEADRKLKEASLRLEELRKKKAPYSEIRTAECDWFGAEEIVTLARLAGNNELNETMKYILPAEIQIFEIDNNYFVCLPGEYFVEYSIYIKEKSPCKVFVITLANGDLQSYIVTQDAYTEGGYEACNSLFPPEAGEVIAREAVRLIKARFLKTP